MQRREFITLLGGAAASVPFAARAQQAPMPVIGFLSTRSARDLARLIAAFGKGLEEAGFSEGNNLSIDYRFADGRLDRLPELAADLVRRSVAVLVTTGGAPSAFAAKAATSTIPIVFVIGGDPVGLGLATSLSRPGGNVTGMTIIAADLAPKRLGLLRELVPNATAFAVLTIPIRRRAGGSRPTCALWRRRWDLNFAFLKQATRGESKARSQPLRRTNPSRGTHVRHSSPNSLRKSAK